MRKNWLNLQKVRFLKCQNLQKVRFFCKGNILRVLNTWKMGYIIKSNIAKKWLAFVKGTLFYLHPLPLVLVVGWGVSRCVIVVLFGGCGCFILAPCSCLYRCFIQCLLLVLFLVLSFILSSIINFISIVYKNKMVQFI